MDINNLKAASKTVDKPQWVGEDVHGLEGVELQVLSRDSKEQQREMTRIIRGLSSNHRDENGALTPDTQDAIDDATLVASLKGWKGLTQDGEEVLFSPKMAETLCESSVFWVALRTAVVYGSPMGVAVHPPMQWPAGMEIG